MTATSSVGVLHGATETVCIFTSPNLAEWVRDALCNLCGEFTEEGGEEAGLPRADLDALIAGIDSATLLLRDRGEA